MPPETHGEVVYEAPAELWSGLYMLFSTLVLIGLWRRITWLICLGASIGLMTNVVFAVAAHEAEFGYLLEKGAARDAFQYAGLLLVAYFYPFKGKSE